MRGLGPVQVLRNSPEAPWRGQMGLVNVLSRPPAARRIRVPPMTREATPRVLALHPMARSPVYRAVSGSIPIEEPRRLPGPLLHRLARSHRRPGSPRFLRSLPARWSRRHRRRRQDPGFRQVPPRLHCAVPRHPAPIEPRCFRPIHPHRRRRRWRWRWRPHRPRAFRSQDLAQLRRGSDHPRCHRRERNPVGSEHQSDACSAAAEFRRRHRMSR
ncbi:Uncharacterised protein [Mycobacteroides abscessus]|nr:Uncharacterised protein [Mycobacteroides abscessus]